MTPEGRDRDARLKLGEGALDRVGDVGGREGEKGELGAVGVGDSVLAADCVGLTRLQSCISVYWSVYLLALSRDLRFIVAILL